MLKRCECCKGRKEIIGLGLLMKKCTECKGVGWIEEADPEIVIDAIANQCISTDKVTTKIKKKRGRKPKIKHKDVLYASQSTY